MLVMKPFLYKVATLFPKTMGGRIVAVLGYITSAAGIALSVNYLLIPLSKCDVDTKGALVISSLIIGFIQLLLAVGFARMVWALTRRNSLLYKLLVFTGVIILLFGELAFAIGYAFGMGTACTT